MSTLASREVWTMVFPVKIHRMLMDAESSGNDDIISWLPDGKAFKIHDRERFISQIMPSYFGTSKFRSFQRNLNLWNFEIERNDSSKKVGDEIVSHPLFRRDAPELCEAMKREKVKKKKSEQQQGGAGPSPPSPTSAFAAAARRKKGSNSKQSAASTAAVVSPFVPPSNILRSGNASLDCPPMPLPGLPWAATIGSSSSDNSTFDTGNFLNSTSCNNPATTDMWSLQQSQQQQPSTGPIQVKNQLQLQQLQQQLQQLQQQKQQLQLQQQKHQNQMLEMKKSGGKGGEGGRGWPIPPPSLIGGHRPRQQQMQMQLQQMMMMSSLGSTGANIEQQNGSIDNGIGSAGRREDTIALLRNTISPPTDMGDFSPSSGGDDGNSGKRQGFQQLQLLLQQQQKQEDEVVPFDDNDDELRDHFLLQQQQQQQDHVEQASTSTSTMEFFAQQLHLLGATTGGSAPTAATTSPAALNITEV